MEFKRYKLNDLSIDGGSYGIGASAVEYNKELYIYLRITDINEDGTLNYKDMMSVDDPKANQYVLKKNDICFARTGNSTGKSYFYDGSIKNLVYAGFLIKFSIDEDKVNPKYIKYYTMTSEYKNWVKEIQTGSTRGNINAKMYGNLDILIPERAYQDKLVAVLDKITDKIKYNTQTNDNLFELTKQLYKRWFIEFEFPNKDGNPYKASNGKMVESELGLIPENWCIKRLDEISVNFDSKRKPLSSKDREERKGNIPYYGATSIIDYVNEYIFDDIFVLMGEDGSVINSDNTPVLQYIWKKCWINNHAHVLQGKGISTEHLMECLRATDVSSIITGAVQLKINQANMNALKYVYATEETNRDFDEKISKIYEKIRANIEQNEILEQLRDTLLPKLMNGEIDLDKIEI